MFISECIMNIPRTTLRKPLLAALALAGLGLAGQAQAAAVAYASVQIFDFQINTFGTATLLSTGRSATAAATVNGSGSTNSVGPGNILPADVSHRFVGAGIDVGENVYSYNSATSNAASLTLTATAARADARTALSTIAQPIDGRIGLFSQNVSEVRADSAATAGSSSANPSSRTISFKSNTDDITLSFDALIRRYASALASGEFAQANTGLIFSLSRVGDNDVYFTGISPAWNTQCSQDAGVGSCNRVISYDSAGLVAGGAITLTPDWDTAGVTDRTGGDWSLAINITSSATATATHAPEPTTISLLGAGLVGLAAARRRKARGKEPLEA